MSPPVPRTPPPAERAPSVPPVPLPRKRMELPAGMDINMQVRVMVPSTGEVYEGGAVNVLRAMLSALERGHTVHLGRIRSGGGECPDDGACHHSCMGSSCFRVRSCAPLSCHAEAWTPAEVRERG